jgi:hypothetical protein
VATVPLLDGITFDWLGVALELELELELELDELLLELEVGGGRQGGTISVFTLLLAGSTSWSWAVAPVVALLFAPPGVMRIVLAGGGAIVGALLLELLDELELLELDPGEPQGSIATVWVSELFGITIMFEPGGTVLLPDCETTAASEHEVTAMVSGLCWLGITTVLTPGLVRAAVTGSELDELDELPPLLPHAASPAAVPHTANAIRQRRGGVRFLMLSSGVVSRRAGKRPCDEALVPQRLPTRNLPTVTAIIAEPYRGTR